MMYYWCSHHHLIHKSGIISDDNTETVQNINLFERVFMKSTLGKILTAMDEHETKDITASYLDDYVHFVYHAKSEEEQVVTCLYTFTLYFLVYSFLSKELWNSFDAICILLYHWKKQLLSLKNFVRDICFYNNILQNYKNLQKINILAQRLQNFPNLYYI